MKSELRSDRAVLLDVDGTLIDSNDAHARAWVDVGREHGIPIHFEDVRPLIGMGSDKVVPILAGVERESERGNQLAERHGQVFRERYLPHLRAFHGTHALLRRMQEEGLSLVVATSASRQDMRAIFSQIGIRELVDDQTSSDDADESKPDPDIVAAALKKSGARAEDAVMVGDTPYDIEAAARAGVRCIVFRCGGWWSDEELRGAVAIYDDPADLLERWDESLLAGAE